MKKITSNVASIGAVRPRGWCRRDKDRHWLEAFRDAVQIRKQWSEFSLFVWITRALWKHTQKVFFILQLLIVSPLLNLVCVKPYPHVVKWTPRMLPSKCNPYYIDIYIHTSILSHESSWIASVFTSLMNHLAVSDFLIQLGTSLATRLQNFRPDHGNIA